jgi:hypothetical protein
VSKPIIHGADHLPGHADPIPGLSFGSLPPQFDYSGDLPVLSLPIGGATQPTVSEAIALIMVQTEDGTSFDDGGTPLEHGTAIFEFWSVLDSPGEVTDSGSNLGQYVVAVTSAGGTYSPWTVDLPRPMAIGSGWIEQDGVRFGVVIDAFGQLHVPNLPDISPPDPSVAGLARIGGDGLLPWPFDWETGAIFTGFGHYAMKVD